MKILICAVVFSTVIIHASAADHTGGKVSNLSPLVRLLGQIDDADFQLDVLRGIYDAVKGRRSVAMPDGWKRVYRKLAKSRQAAVREQALLLSLMFGDRQAATLLRKTTANRTAKREARTEALRALVQARTANLVPFLRSLLDDAVMRGPALRGMAAFDDQTIPRIILQRYATFNDSEKQDAVNTLASRPAFALALLDSVDKGRVPSRDLSAFTARQMMSLDDPAIVKRLQQIWGSVRRTAEDRVALIADYKRRLTPDVMKAANRPRGRLVFQRTCASCHKLFDDGKSIGPELTGSQRRNLDYLLTNLLDPNAIIGRDYRLTVVVTDGGRVLTGIVRQEDNQTLTLQTANDRVTIPKDEIDVRKLSPLSMMPEGMLRKLNTDEVRDLLAYLASSEQVPLPADIGTPSP
jgi:putative heme-binding domain-containing protein